MDANKVAWCVELARQAHKLAKTCDRLGDIATAANVRWNRNRYMESAKEAKAG